jgi:predicted transcriptional regulator
MQSAKSEKRQFLVHLEPSLIQRTKILAVTRGTTASALVQQALIELIERIAQEPEHVAAGLEGQRQ